MKSEATQHGRIRVGQPPLHEKIETPPASREGQFQSLRDRVTTVRLPRK